MIRVAPRLLAVGVLVYGCWMLESVRGVSMQPNTPTLTFTPTLALITPLTVALNLNPNSPNKIVEKWRCKVFRRRSVKTQPYGLSQFSIIYFRGLGLTIGG